MSKTGKGHQTCEAINTTFPLLLYNYIKCSTADLKLKGAMDKIESRTL